MRRELHVRFSEGGEVRLLPATRRNIFVHTERAGKRVMASTRRFIERRLRLQVNDAKSAVAPPDVRHFLGFRLCREPAGNVEVHISKKTKERIDARIRALTPRTWGQSLGQCLAEANRYLRGWAAYFRLCGEQGAAIFKRLDAHIRRRIRAIIVHQKKRPRFLLRHLLQRGVSLSAARATAYSRRGIWHQSNRSGMTAAYRNAWFRGRLVSLWSEWCRHNPPQLVSGQALLFGD